MARREFDLDNPRGLRAISITTRTHKHRWWFLAGLLAIWYLIAVAMATAYDQHLIGPRESERIALWMGAPLVALVLCDLLLLTPIARAYRRRAAAADRWVHERQGVFVSALPDAWGPGSDWDHLSSLSTNIDVMPDNYMNFKHGWMLDFPERLPRCAGPSRITRRRQAI
jgi:hypothetical protein